jgi:hypothetical protein
MYFCVVLCIFVLFYVFFVLFYVFLCFSTYFCVVLCIFVLFYVFLCCYTYCSFRVVLRIVCVYMCTELLPQGGYPIAVKHIISCIIWCDMIRHHINTVTRLYDGRTTTGTWRLARAVLNSATVVSGIHKILLPSHFQTHYFPKSNNKPFPRGLRPIETLGNAHWRLPMYRHSLWFPASAAKPSSESFLDCCNV